MEMYWTDRETSSDTKHIAYVTQIGPGIATPALAILVATTITYKMIGLRVSRRIRC